MPAHAHSLVPGSYSQPQSTLPVSVITTCYGRNSHLYNLLTSLVASSARPAEVIVVNDDADKERLASFALNIVQLPTTAGFAEAASINGGAELSKGFDIGRNRNVGAHQASFEKLIFLDVDCIVSYDFIAGITRNLVEHSKALFMGQPRYLTRPLSESESAKITNLATAEARLNDLSTLNPYRYNQSEQGSDLKKTQDYGAFWSLCFAITQTQFTRIGGFDTHYVGYGAEDTDFAFMARALNIPFYLTNDVVYHQQHSVYRPPLNHLSSIIANANRFYDKWQHWPMVGWLAAFAEMGLIDWNKTQDTPIIITCLPNNEEINAAYCPDAPYV